MEILVALIASIYGAIFGSFTSALIYRLHHEKPGLATGRSACPSCDKKLEAKDLIPLISWVTHKGKCRFCLNPIGLIYPLLELIFAITFAVFAYKFWGTAIFVPIMLTVFVSLVLFFYDTLYQEVDLRIILPAILLALIWSFFRELPWHTYWLAGGLGFSFYALQYYASGGKWVGDGDMFLGAFIGLILGLKLGFISFFLAYIIGCLVAIYLIAFKKATGKTAVPMGAFLMPSLLIVLWGGEFIWDWYWSLISF